MVTRATLCVAPALESSGSGSEKVIAARCCSVAIGRGKSDGPRAYAAAEVERVRRIVGDVSRLEHQRMGVGQIIGVHRKVEATEPHSRASGKIVDDRESGNGRIVKRVILVLSRKQRFLRGR